MVCCTEAIACLTKPTCGREKLAGVWHSDKVWAAWCLP